jgi:uncharacterized metal-binding protein
MENLEYEMQFIGHCSEWQEELLCFLFVKLYVGVKCMAILLYTKRAQMYANFKKIGIAICFVNGGRESRLSCAHQSKLFFSQVVCCLI